MASQDFIRNICIIAHVDSGKTTLTERILFAAGKINKIGEVHDGAATMDSDTQEQERGITIHSAATTINWTMSSYKDCPQFKQEHKINLIDTPGHVDFSVEVIRSLKSCDGVVLVVCGVAGAQAQTSVVWRMAQKYHNIGSIFINKMDRQGADFFRVRKQMEQKLAIKTCTLTIPVGSESDFNGVIDLVEGKYLKWQNKKSGQFDYNIEEIPSEYQEIYKKEREDMILTALEGNDELTNKYLETETISTAELYQQIRVMSVSKRAVIINCGAAYKNIGAQIVLDGVLLGLPAPDYLKSLQVYNNTDDSIYDLKLVEDETTVAQAFKIVKDKFSGQMVFIRVYSGILKKGDAMFNSRTRKTARIGKIVMVHASQKEQVEELSAGNIGAVIGLDAITSDTLCSKGYNYSIDSIEIPPVVIQKIIIPKSKQDSEKIAKGLSDYSREDPSFRVDADDHGNIVVGGIGDLHIEVKMRKLSDDTGAQFTLSKPIVNYHETVNFSKKEVHDVQHIHKKQTGGAGQFAHIMFKVEAGDPDQQLIFVNKVIGGHIPSEYIPSVETGFKKALARGPVLKSEVTGLKITLYDGNYHSVDSSTLAFEICARNALHDFLRDQMEQNNLDLLEPNMSTYVYATEAYLGEITGDISRRGGTIHQTENDAANNCTIHAYIPLREMSDYISYLRSATKGQATYESSLHDYKLVDKYIVEAIRKERGIV